MALARRTVVWLWLSAAGGVMALLMGGLLSWYQLPRWAPDWVVEHSPVVEPFVRAIAQIRPGPSGTPQSEYGFPGGFKMDALYEQEIYRLGTWGEKAIPGLERCLRDENPVIRLHAFRLLRYFERPSRVQARQLLTDPDPWMRDFAWRHLVKFPHAADASADDQVATIAAAMTRLADHDGFIRENSRDYLAANAELLWDQRGELNGHLQQLGGPAFLADVVASLCQHGREVGDGAPLPKDLYFPLLSLTQWPDADGVQEHIFAYWIPYFAVDYADLYTRLSAMQDGGVPSEPGVQPWMHEQLQRLSSRRITATLVEVDAGEVATRLFPHGNVLIHPDFGTPRPPVSMVIDNQPMIDVLIALAQQLKAELHLDNGVAALLPLDLSPRGPIHGLIPSPMIAVAWDVEAQSPLITGWQTRLKQKVSLRCKSVDLAREFAERGRQIGLPIDFQVIEQGVWPDEVEFHDLPLEQILRFWAGFCVVRLELGRSGLRTYSP